MNKFILLLSISFILSGCTQIPVNDAVQISEITSSTKDVVTSIAVETTSSAQVAEPVVTPSAIYYKVISVVDGDTIKVNIDGKTETIRLIGIDTPETVDPRKVVQCFGKEASNKAKEWLTGKIVELETDPISGDRDKYDRLLRFVKVKDGIFYNIEIIKQGYAHEYTYNSEVYKYQSEFKAAEKYARENKLGLWSDNTCAGDTTKAAITATSPSLTTAPVVTPTPTSNSSPQVKKSTTSICHEIGTTYYARTTNFTPYNSISECIASGGRLPLR